MKNASPIKQSKKVVTVSRNVEEVAEVLDVEKVDLNEALNPSVHAYDEELSKVNMDETVRLTKSVRNFVPEDEDWEERINKILWTKNQLNLFTKIVSILDADRLSRLTYTNRLHEPIQRRITIDKSAQRFRKALSEVYWESSLVQWLHEMLMSSMPPTYIAVYLDIMQVLKTKVPSLVDNMIFWKPHGNVNQDLLAPIYRRPWQPTIASKNRKLPGQPLIVVVPSAPKMSTTPSRAQKLYSLFSTMASVLPIQLNINTPSGHKQSLQSVAEQMISVTRTKLQDLRSENPNRPLILVGFNAGAALAMQVALVEQVSAVICFGFAFNTVHGCRGAPDDHILDLTTPCLFLVGQNSSRTSPEEIEALREKMVAPTSLVVLGSADDGLRISKVKRKLEMVTQEMVDNMLMDEVAEFATKCVSAPPPPPKTHIRTVQLSLAQAQMQKVREASALATDENRKRKFSHSEFDSSKALKQFSNQRIHLNVHKPKPTSVIASQSQEALGLAIQSILPANDPPKVFDITGDSVKPSKHIKIQGNTFKAMVPQTQKLKVISQGGQFIHLKPAPQKIYHVKNNSNPSSRDNSRPSTPTSTTSYYISHKGQLISQSTKLQPQIQMKEPSNDFSPTKFSIMKHPQTSDADMVTPDLTNTSILDLPIIFADNDGNIEEEVVTTEPSGIRYKPVNTTGVIKKSIVINRQGAKMVLINKGAVLGKPIGNVNVIGRATGNLQKILMTNSKQTTKIITIPSNTLSNSTMSCNSGKKVEIINNTLIKPASTVTGKFQPYILNVDHLSDKGPYKNVFKLTDGKTVQLTRSISPNASIASTSGGITKLTTVNSKQPSIVIKSNTLKPLGNTKLSGMLNRNLTVKKINVIHPGAPQLQQQLKSRAVDKKDSV